MLGEPGKGLIKSFLIYGSLYKALYLSEYYDLIP